MPHSTVSSGTWPGAFTAATLGTNAGDFTLNYNTGANVITISASGAGGAIPASASHPVR